MGDVIIRHATEADAEAIRQIYNYEVEHETATFDLVPRSLEDQSLGKTPARVPFASTSLS